MKTQLPLFLAASLLQPVGSGGAQHEAAKDWLASNAIPLRTVEAGHGFMDMQPLKELIGSARVVALGEATHGTREFFQLKHRMLEFLVEEMGFTVFGIEATMPEGFDLNEYILTGEGDPAKALAALYFWTWDTEEVLEMIRWMRRYNADPAHEKKVRFYGFDMQSVTRAVKVTLSYLRRVDAQEAAIAQKTFDLLSNPFTQYGFDLLPQERKESVARYARALLTRFDERREGYVARAGVTEWALARQHARIVVQNLESRMPPRGTPTFASRSRAVRDRAMAENIAWILEHEGTDAKMVIWAHNGHVGTFSAGAFESMGAHLRRRFSDDMVVFGFAFNQGGFQAIEMPFWASGGLRSYRVDPAPEGSLDATLAAAGLSIAAVDLRTLPETGPVAEWFAEPRITRSIGAGYRARAAAGFLGPQEVTKRYDALLFVETTTAARSNPWVTIPPSAKLPSPINLGFETGRAGEPPGNWRVHSGIQMFDFQIVTTEDRPHSDQRCVVIQRDPGRHYGELYGSLSQRIDAAPYRGRRVRLRAAVRADLQESGSQAYLWLRVTRRGFGPDAVAFYDDMADRPIVARAWTEFEIIGDVPADADAVDYGLALVGDGRVWLDSVSIEDVSG